MYIAAFSVCPVLGISNVKILKKYFKIYIGKAFFLNDREAWIRAAATKPVLINFAFETQAYCSL